MPKNMAGDFEELINPKILRFKGELVRSLRTKDLKEAKRLDHQEALDELH